jgi:hypothetical protein
MFPEGTDRHGFGASFKEEVRKNPGSCISMGAFGEGLAHFENYVDLDPVVKDKWGIPALRFHYKFGDNEHRMAEDMKETAQEMFEEAGFNIVHVNAESPGNGGPAGIRNEWERMGDSCNGVALPAIIFK